MVPPALKFCTYCVRGRRQWRPLYWCPFVRSVVPQDDLSAVGSADHQVRVELRETRRHHRRLKHTTKYMKIQVKLSTTDWTLLHANEVREKVTSFYTWLWFCSQGKVSVRGGGVSVQWGSLSRRVPHSVCIYWMLSCFTNKHFKSVPSQPKKIFTRKNGHTNNWNKLNTSVEPYFGTHPGPAGTILILEDVLRYGSPW